VSYLDDKYIGLISSRLEKFKRVKAGLYNFRCPYCGDSQKHKNKARGYIYQVKADYNFKCHNCGASRSFTYFLKDRDKPLYDQYVMERYSSGLTGKSTVTPEPEFKFEKPKFKSNDICDELDKISALNKTHSARCYLVNRGIKEEDLRQFYYCPNFKEWTNKHKRTFDSIKNDEARIIIPLRDSESNLFGYQGRSLDPKAKMRYITIMLKENLPKIYGLDRIEQDKTVYVVEGPFDSTFVKNSIAMCGSDSSLAHLKTCNIVYVYDNEPRNKEIVNRIEKCVRDDKRVVIWPNNIKQKDINDMVLAGHDIMSILRNSTYSGLEGTLKLTHWKKT
jgi:predicted RNA-binding Zn-ribbon protein involved in translation (DUF1610 family)